MKKIFVILMCSVICSATFSQNNAEKVNYKKASDDAKYRRSSLDMVLIEMDDFPEKSDVQAAWDSLEFPAKYNNHNIDAKTLDKQNYPITQEDRIALGLKGNKSSMDTRIQIDKYIEDQDIARRLVGKWFNESNGTMNFDLVAQRGFYNASDMDAAIVSGQARGRAALGDAGFELIDKTFITFSELNFVDNEPAAAIARDAAIIAAQMIPMDMLRVAAVAAANAAYEAAKEGYSVWTTTYLYKLDWSEEVAGEFLQMLYGDKDKFYASDIFKLNFVGQEKSKTLVLMSKNDDGTQKDNSQLIHKATGRNVNLVFRKLQKNYDSFKPKTPIYQIDDKFITAKVGTKEGLGSKSKFEVLEKVWNEKTQTTTWSRVCILSVSKKFPIWENQFNAGEEVEPQLNSKGEQIVATHFKGNKAVRSGMLLRQIK